ncbi:MAG: hypothetical protein LBE84_01735 [Planctomycetota bacterium]|jgi:hypothetical protein|nr:hypothetical protein [Planctomycetota bacterium]
MFPKTVLAALVAVLGRLSGLAADLPPALDPAVPPLAVVRTIDLSIAEKLSADPLGQALGVPGAFGAHALPGFRGATFPFRDWILAWRDSGARDFWYCLFSGAGPGSVAAAAGGDWPAAGDTPAFADWLAGIGLNAKGLALGNTSPAPGVERRIAAADAETLRLALGGTERRERNDEWRNRLAAFMLARPAGIAVWLNARPLFGMLSLLLGADLRAELGSREIRLPETLAADLFPANGGLACILRLNHVLEKPVPKMQTGDVPLPPAERTGIVLTDVSALLHVLGLGDNPLFAADVDFRALKPEAIGISVWQDRTGETRWSVAGVIGQPEAFRRQWRRLLAWCDLLAGIPDSGFAVSKIASPPGEFRRRIDFGETSLVVGLGQRKGDGGTLLLAAGRAEDYPEASDLVFETGRGRPLLSWRFVSVDGLLEKALARIDGRSVKIDIKTGAAVRTLLTRSSGSLDLDGTDAILIWKSGTE